MRGASLSSQGNGPTGPEASPCLHLLASASRQLSKISSPIQEGVLLFFSVSNECYCSFKVFKYVILLLSTVDLAINKIPSLLLSSVAENRYNTNCTHITSKIV